MCELWRIFRSDACAAEASWPPAAQLPMGLFCFGANAPCWPASKGELYKVFLIHVCTEEPGRLFPFSSILALIQFNDRNMFVVRNVTDFSSVP